MDNLDLLWQAWQPLIIGCVTVGVVFAVIVAFVRLGFQYAWWILGLAFLVYLFS